MPASPLCIILSTARKKVIYAFCMQVEIMIAGCAAYGAVHQQPESHDYEIPKNYAVISQTDNPPAEAVYEPIPGDSQ